MVDRIRVIAIIFFSLTSIVFSSEQYINIVFHPTFSGASAQVVGEKQVIDLGFLKEGHAYTGVNKIEIGTVSVSIRQNTVGSEEACLPNDIQFNSVNLGKLKTMSEVIASTEKSYIGNYSGMSLSAGGISNIKAVGRTIDESTESYFVDPRCNMNNMNNIIFTLDYEFKLYADIPMTEKGVTGAFAQEKNTEKEIALKDVVIRQIQGSVGMGTGNENRRR